PKVGFTVPLSPWFRGPLRELVTDTLLSPTCLGRGYYKPEALRGVVEDHVEGRRDRARELWTLLSLELWHRRFIDRAEEQRQPAPGAPGFGRAWAGVSMSFEFEAGFFHDALRRHGLRPRRILVVGCGPGVELAHIARATGANVVGIDLVVDPRQRGEAHALVRADATRLPFRDGFFDSVYCYHVLEHVPSPEVAVSEAHRVLRPEGLGYFGTPNRSRLVGYIGGRATNWGKVAWNAKDYWHPLTRRRSNARGAHAGFPRAGRARGALTQ